jgi:hypothetical protein
MPSLQPWIFLLAATVPVILFAIRRKRPNAHLRLVLGLAAAIVVILAFSTFTPSNFSTHHLVMVYPLQQALIVASAFLIISEVAGRGAALVRRLVMGLVVLTILWNVIITLHNHMILRETGGVGMWSAAIYELNEYLMVQDRPVICMDWGLCHNLQMLSLGELETSDQWANFLYPVEDRSPMVELLQVDNLFVFHSPKYTGVYTITSEDFPRQTFFETADTLGLRVENLRVIRQDNSEPLYEIYVVND